MSEGTNRAILTWAALLWASAVGLHAQAAAQPNSTVVRGRVEVIGASAAHPRHAKTPETKVPETVVWLTPMATPGDDAPAIPVVTPAQNLRLVQKNKSFEPHILVVPAGSMVEFPNRDPFFHNVFSLFEGKKFDLGLYEAGTTRMVRFDRAGISYIFCNIHPEMSAVVITLATPLYAISNAEGQVSLPNVPYGRYMLHIWSEGMGPENAQPLTREITITDSSSTLGVIRVPEANGPRMAHKNKYGRDYDQPTPDSPVYGQTPQH